MHTSQATTFVHPYKAISPSTLMTVPREPRRRGRFTDERRRAAEAEERWRDAGYATEVIDRLHWDRRYSVLKIGELELAYSDYRGFVAALHAAWDAGYVPAAGHSSVRGADLPDAAPSLSGVDVDLSSQEVLPRHRG